MAGRPDADKPHHHETLEFRVSAVFTITGRGLVAAGVTEQGSVRAGDRVEVVRGSRRIPAVCRGVEMIHADRSVPLETIGLLLPDLTREDVEEGDLIVSSRWD